MNKKKKWLMIILGIILIIGVIVGIWLWKNVEIETSQITEYTPDCLLYTSYILPFLQLRTILHQFDYQ